MTSRTVRQYRNAVARKFNDYWTGTLTSTAASGATVLKDTTRVEVDGFFRNGFIRLNPGSSAVNHRIVESYVDEGTLNIAGVGLAGELASGVAYDLYKNIPAADYDSLIDEAILSTAREGQLSSLDNTSITLVGGVNDNSYEYTMPSGFSYISEIWIADSAGNYTNFVPLDMVTLLPGSTRKLRFSRHIPITDGRAVRLLGQGVHAINTTGDNFAITLDNDYISTHLELGVAKEFSKGEGSVAVNADRRVRDLTQMVEIRRGELATGFRVTPGSLVVPI